MKPVKAGLKLVEGGLWHLAMLRGVSGSVEGSLEGVSRGEPGGDVQSAHHLVDVVLPPAQVTDHNGILGPALVEDRLQRQPCTARERDLRGVSADLAYQSPMQHLAKFLRPIDPRLWIGEQQDEHDITSCPTVSRGLACGLPPDSHRRPATAPGQCSAGPGEAGWMSAPIFAAASSSTDWTASV